MLSAIVPIAKMAGKLANLESWLAKVSHYEMEVVLVHDEQDDETGPELLNLLTKLNSPKVTLISGKWGNPGSARNAGLEVAEGDLVVFWDSDDIPNLELFLSRDIYEKTFDVLVFEFNVMDFTSGKSRRIENHPFDNRYLGLNPGIWRMVFTRKILEDARFPPLKLAEDQIFLARVLEKSPFINYVQESAYTYMINFSGQLTKTQSLTSQAEEIMNCLGKCSRNTKTHLDIVIAMQVKIFLGIVKRDFLIGTRLLWLLMWKELEDFSAKRLARFWVTFLFVVRKNQFLA